MSFADKVNEAIRQAAATPESDHLKYTQVLEELAEALSNEGVIARIVQSAAPRTLWLTLAPPCRPGQRSPMLRFEIGTDKITVSDAPPRVFSTVDELEKELLRFVSMPAFVETLHILRTRGNEPVDARLHHQTSLPATALDIFVEVSASDQKRLYESQIGSNATIKVKRLQYMGNGQFSPGGTYDYLESAGVFVEVQDVREENGMLLVTGVRRERFPFVGQ
jgi:hypothetical protein